MRIWISCVLTALLTLAGRALGQESGCLTVKKISPPHHAVHQGEDIELIVTLATEGCNIPFDVTNATQATHLSVYPPEGFGTYPPVAELSGFGNEAMIGNTRKAHQVTARFVLHAARGASLGDYAVPATLKYTAEDLSGNTASYSLALNLPVQVVPLSATTSPPDQHGAWREGFTNAGLVLLGIVLFPVALVLGLLGGLNDC